MKPPYIVFSVLVVLMSLCANEPLGGPEPAPPAPENDRPHLMAYWYGGGKELDTTTLQADKMSHLLYAFAIIKEQQVFFEFPEDTTNLRLLKEFKQTNDLQVLVSVGGWGGSGKFSEMADSRANRQQFIESCVELIQEYHLDGIDFDWEYPGLPGNNNPHGPQDTKNFTRLLRETRNALDELGKQTDEYYLLGIAAGAFQRYIDHIELPRVAKQVDFINVMTYDFAITGNNYTDHHACLYAPPKARRHQSGHLSVERFLAGGAPAEKLVIGAAFYGRGWQNVTCSRIPPVGCKGEAYQANLRYHIIRDSLSQSEQFQALYDHDAQAPYLWNEEQGIFITYDDTTSVRAKSRYAKKHQLGGLMFWEYHGDYKHELLTTMAEELWNMDW